MIPRQNGLGWNPIPAKSKTSRGGASEFPRVPLSGRQAQWPESGSFGRNHGVVNPGGDPVPPVKQEGGDTPLAVLTVGFC